MIEVVSNSAEMVEALTQPHTVDQQIDELGWELVSEKVCGQNDGSPENFVFLGYQAKEEAGCPHCGSVDKFQIGAWAIVGVCPSEVIVAEKTKKAKKHCLEFMRKFVKRETKIKSMLQE